MTHNHAAQLAALDRLRTFLDATSEAPDADKPDLPSVRTLRLVADLADARSDAR